MGRVKLKEEQGLRKWLDDHYYPEYVRKGKNSQHNYERWLRRESFKAIRALVAAVREDCIELYYDWCDRPVLHMDLPFPDALRKNIRWKKSIRARGKGE